MLCKNSQRTKLKCERKRVYLRLHKRIRNDTHTPTHTQRHMLPCIHAMYTRSIGMEVTDDRDGENTEKKGWILKVWRLNSEHDANHLIHTVHGGQYINGNGVSVCSTHTIHWQSLSVCTDNYILLYGYRTGGREVCVRERESWLVLVLFSRTQSVQFKYELVSATPFEYMHSHSSAFITRRNYSLHSRRLSINASNLNMRFWCAFIFYCLRAISFWIDFQHNTFL